MAASIVVLKLTAGKYYITATHASPDAILRKHSQTSTLINTDEFTWRFPAIDIQEVIPCEDIYDLTGITQRYASKYGDYNVLCNRYIEHIA